MNNPIKDEFLQLKEEIDLARATVYLLTNTDVRPGRDHLRKLNHLVHEDMIKLMMLAEERESLKLKVFHIRSIAFSEKAITDEYSRGYMDAMKSIQDCIKQKY